ncbi:hypothetical protein ACFLT2_09020 [Acidobacteriota bacterium]
MRKQKRIVLVVIVCFLSSSVMFSQIGRDEQKKILNSNNRNSFSLKNKLYTRLGGYKKHPYSRVSRQCYTFSVRDNFYQLVPINVTVRFKRPVSDFEAAYLFDHYRLKKSTGMKVTDNPFLSMFTGDRPEEPTVHILKRNPQVDSPELQGLHHLRNRPDDLGEYAYERPRRLLGRSQPLEAHEKKDMSYEKTQKRTNRVLASTEDSTKNIRVSDANRITRSKAKIYTYRDSEGRLVITNYGRSKRKSIKK